MRILLSGSGGFIGKNLKSYLEDKFELLTPRSFELDLTDDSSVRDYFLTHKIDLVIHCASVGGARGITDKDSTVQDNLAMVENILKYKETCTKVITFGSGAMYDKSRDLKKVPESEIGNFEPKDLYGKSKMLIAEEIKDRKDVLCLNIFGCYGCEEKENRFPSYAINQVLKGEDIIINQNVIFDYLFVEDMQKIVEHFLQNKPAKENIINITPTESASLLEIANIINSFSEKKVQIKILNNEMNFEYTGDNKRLLENLPDFEFTQMKTGLKKLFDYKKERLLITKTQGA